MDIIAFSGAVALLFLSLSACQSRWPSRLRLPFTVILAIMGALYRCGGADAVHLWPLGHA